MGQAPKTKENPAVTAMTTGFENQNLTKGFDTYRVPVATHPAYVQRGQEFARLIGGRR